ncbi:adenylate/guanylate cyclase domain-containing protein [Afipia sp. GAS231]|uniref:adenylate/guanylate cyclase domain-containing protein n=1 Tax=Afipia sp. GAS231 TaxID=1882747 RepID=UPI00087B5342|nr:adenylate/guanylate cyclase domain-containing protein [Afipia sp. GAS231]SDM94148.1 adenylate/guanylate cyclase [Afipia sp. GAS231]
MQQIEEWLEKLGMSGYAQRFLENRIDISVLGDLNDEDLRELGVVLGDRKKILRAIHNLHTAETTASAATPTESAPDAAERRQLTVMFCDLVGSTALSTQLDPEDLRKIIGAYHRTCAAVVEQIGGFVAKYMGDGVLIYFGYPRAHEHDAEHAVQAALAIVAAVAKLDTAAPNRLEVRVGIATGIVVVGDIVGSGEAQERGVVGETPNLAARLQAIAQPGMIVIADATRRLVGDLFLLTSLGPQHLKGLPGPVQAWAVDGANAIDGRFDALHLRGLGALIARERESAFLGQSWSRARMNEGQVVLIAGEAGIGKSRLVAAVLEQVAADAPTQLRYYCSPQHTNSPLHPVIKEMERRANFTREDDLKAKLDKLDAMLGRSSEAVTYGAPLADLLQLANDGRYPADDLTPAQRRQRTFEAIVLQTQNLARSGPVLLIFEDLHWIDPTSLELLGQLMDAIAALPVLLVATFRTEFEPPWAARPHITVMEIARLGPQQTEALLNEVIGERPLPAHIRKEIIDRADGIPLFVQEMTKAVLEAGSETRPAGAIPAAASSVPATLHASLMARLDRLGPAKEVAQMAAAIGREFNHALLAAIVPLTEPELNRSLDRLAGAGLLFRQGVPPDATYLFNHALVQEAAYGTLLREKRRALHAVLAETIETDFADIADSQPEVLARHYTEAGLLEKAASLWSKAGSRSLSRSALVEAAEQLARALDLIAKLPETAALRRERITLQIELANALIHTKGHAAPETRAAFDHARALIEHAEALGDTTDDPMVLFAVLYGFWVASRMSFQAEVTCELAAQFQALAEQRQARTPVMIGHLLMGISRVLAGELAVGSAELDRAVALYHHPEHRPLAMRFGHDVLVSALSWRAFSQWALGRTDAATADVERAIREAREFDHAATLMYALAHVSLALIYMGKLTAAAELADELMRLADGKGSRFWNAYGKLLRGRLLSLEGQDHAAADMIEAGISAMRSTGATAYAPWYLSILGAAYARIGRLGDARRYSEDALQSISDSGECWQEAEAFSIAGSVMLALDPPDVREAHAHFQRSLVVARRQMAKSFELTAAESLTVLSER